MKVLTEMILCKCVLDIDKINLHLHHTYKIYIVEEKSVGFSQG